MSIKDIKMIGPHYVCVLYVSTSGVQGALMGSDEQEIVLLIYVIIDVLKNQIVGFQQYIVRPQVADINENIVSDELACESKLTDDLIKASGHQLEDAFCNFEDYCLNRLHIDPRSSGFRFITDGQLPIRQCLHPETCRKEIPLPDYYNVFHDIRKDVCRHLGKDEDETPGSINDMLECLEMSPDTDNEFYKTEAKDMVNVVHKLIINGYRFDNPEVVNLTLEPGICSKDDEIDNNCVVRARGLPWQSSDQDIAKFFCGLNVAKGGVALCLSHQGRRNGEALIRFENQEHRDMALKRHKHHIGTRYIEVYRASGDDFLSVAGGTNGEAQAFLSRGANVIVRMRGLPYECTANQVLDFFASGENSCDVLDGTDGVLFVRKPDGRATGDAFVLFSSESDAPKALSKHRESIGTRYIELFRSTTAEVQQVLNRSLDPKNFEPPAPLIPHQVPLMPQHIITSGTRRDCIRLRGLPYEAQVEHILDFLGEFAQKILFQGVHMVYNAQGQPSGEAFIQMDGEHSAFITAQQKHHRYMVFGKKQRYIEVFQCSGEDMNLVLTVGLPSALSPTKGTAPSAALLSPGMLPIPLTPSSVPLSVAPTNCTTAITTATPNAPHHHYHHPAPHPPPSALMPWDGATVAPPPALIAAQHQAHFIAQQNLFARQSQATADNILLMNQLALLNQAALVNAAPSGGGAGTGSLLKQSAHASPVLMMPPNSAAALSTSTSLLMLPPPLAHLGAVRPTYMSPSIMHASNTAGNLMSAVPHVAVKRSYGDAFSDAPMPAKRSLNAQNSLHQYNHHYYANI